MKTPTLLSLHNISKRFATLKANDKVSMLLREGEIHALLGENGAGKSTLVKIIYGILQPDSGTIHWQGKEARVSDPAQARKLGIGMVFQHFSLFSAMTVAENIQLGLPASLDNNSLAQRIATLSRDYGLHIDSQRYIYTLSVGECQRVEIIRCLLQNPKLLIMDEPTSVLTPQEATALFKTLRKLARSGCAILYISHRLGEIRQLCHRATIMRLGKVVAQCDPAKETTKSLAKMMMGKDIKTAQRTKTAYGESMFIVNNLSFLSTHVRGVSLQNISFQIRSGEILGIAGLAGNGQRELLAVLNGEQLSGVEGDIVMKGRHINHYSADMRRQAGLNSIPEERLGHSAVADFSLWENTILSAREKKKLVKKGFLDIAESRVYANHIVNQFSVKAQNINQSASSLSGGNLQKFVVGRELLQTPQVCIAAQPGWGLDAGSAAGIHQALLNLAAHGAAVVVISQDIDELFTICSHIAVIYEGQLTAPQPIVKVTPQRIGLLMGGHTQQIMQ